MEELARLLNFLSKRDDGVPCLRSERSTYRNIAKPAALNGRFDDLGRNLGCI